MSSDWAGLDFGLVDCRSKNWRKTIRVTHPLSNGKRLDIVLTKLPASSISVISLVIDSVPDFENISYER